VLFRSHIGTLPAFVAAALSIVNLLLALRTLPESHPVEARAGASVRRGTPLDMGAIRVALRVRGMPVALATNFFIIMWFSGMEQTFRLFNVDVFGISPAGTGAIFMLVGVVSATTQGGLVGRLSRRFGEARLIIAGATVLGVAFALLAASPTFGAFGKVALYASAALIALGSGLATPSLPSYASKHTGPNDHGLVLGTLQSASALGRVAGPAIGGLLYSTLFPAAPYAIGAIGLLLVAVLATARLPD
jgi:DHA1 family tetracycline resistance protein-like MFS transporter